MGIIRIMLFASFMAGTLAFHAWPRQSESQGEIIHSSPGSSKGLDRLSSLFSFKPPQLKTKQTPSSWESTITQETSWEDILEKLCQENHPGCGISYSGVMFPSGNWPCGRKCF